MHVVYVLRSLTTGKYYMGQAQDIHQRLNDHNQGRNKSTAPGVPWELFWSAEMGSRSSAMALERKLKNLTSEVRFKRFLDKYREG